MGLTMNSKSIDLAPFLGEIENIVTSISHDRLKKNVIAYARDLAPDKRFEFLQMIALDDDTFDEFGPEDYETDAELLADAETFFANITKGAYDHDLDINNPDEVPAWVDDMDILFDRADEAFMFNDRELAAKVYDILFKSLHIAEEIAVEHQLYSAQDIIVTDVTSVKARFLRALFETANEKKKCALMYEAIKSNLAIGSPRTGLSKLLDAANSDIKGWDDFLGKWIDYIKSQCEEDEFENRISNWLLREAVLMKCGFEGLEKLADEEGDLHPEVYYDLVESYVKEGELKKAESSARKGIDKIAKTHQKAVLADWLAELAFKDNDKKLALASRREAWRYEPTQERLVHWFNTLGKVISDDELREEITFLRKSSNPKYVRLVCMLEMLLGEYDLPRKALLASDSLGWRPESHPGPVVLPFLLIAGSGIFNIPENSSLKIVAEEMKSVFIRWQAHLIDGKKDQPLNTYLDYLMDSLKRKPVSEEQKDLFLATARTAILDRMRAIVTEQLEHMYPEVSGKAVAYAEACYLSGQDERGLKLINNIRNMYIRQNSLRNEIRTLFNASPVLPQLTPQGQLTN